MIEQTHDNGKPLMDILITGGIGALLAAFFQAVQLSRRRPGSEPMSYSQICVELAGAGAVGAIVAWGLESFGLGRELSAVIIAMAGYVGGPLLDLMSREVRSTVHAAFDGTRQRLSKGKW